MPDSLPLAALELLPEIDWAEGIRETWTPGETSALAVWQDFLSTDIDTYHQSRNLPTRTGTSRLSPALHFGKIGPRRIWADLQMGTHSSKGTKTYLSELGWREFSCYLLYHFPDMPSAPLRASFADFPWRNDPNSLKAWRKGQTGYPIVDAGMRELWLTGWMHNRVRMITASFLVKHLLVPWQDGAAWFWDTLVDADLANNAQGWQWTAGCGMDAAPYFRIFNPITQGEKFDPQGRYIRTWIPELSHLPDRYLNQPWTAPTSILDKADIVLGKTYPGPIVEHGYARKRALAAYQKMMGRSK
jgi:deoxyribodipyrimidine photo-lyase